MTLDKSLPNHFYQIDAINDTEEQKKRFFRFGFFEGEIVRHVFSAPSGDPIAFEIQGSVFALRKSQLKAVEVHEVHV